MKLKPAFLLVAGNLLLSGCPFMTRDDVQKEEEDKQLREQVAAIQKSKADSEVKYSDVQTDMRTLSGRVEAVDHNQRVSDQNSKAQIEQLRKEIEAQNEKLKALEQHVDATETRLTAAIQASVNNPSTVTSAGSGSSGKEKKSGTFDEAEELFKSKEFKKAIVKYQTYLEKYPKGKNAAESTYKIGLCFTELGMKKEAKEFYQDTIETFPGTKSAKKAQARLSQSK